MKPTSRNNDHLQSDDGQTHRQTDPNSTARLSPSGTMGRVKYMYIWKRTKEAVKSHMKHPQYQVVRICILVFVTNVICILPLLQEYLSVAGAWDQPMRCYLENWGRRVRLLSPTEIWGRRQCLGMMSQMLSLTRSAAEFLIIKILPIS